MKFSQINVTDVTPGSQINCEGKSEVLLWGVKNYQLWRRILDALDDASYSAWKNQPFLQYSGTVVIYLGHDWLQTCSSPVTRKFSVSCPTRSTWKILGLVVKFTKIPRKSWGIAVYPRAWGMYGMYMADHWENAKPTLIFDRRAASLTRTSYWMPSKPRWGSGELRHSSWFIKLHQ
jgi:hypothetical protein